jgi:Fe-S cluster assembly scaffold protein SufB
MIALPKTEDIKFFTIDIDVENPNYKKIDYQAISYFSAPKKKELASLDEVDPELLETYNKLGIPLEEQKEKKKLYREAMLHVHPDKFHLSEKETETATEVTSKLIEIYKTGSLETLQAYHAHIFEGNTNIVLEDSASKIEVLSKDNYLQQEIERLEKDIAIAKDYHLYKVITEYENPLTFVDELKDYYDDRIFKLKKRTRKGF